jgi:hypothetical protein
MGREGEKIEMKKIIFVILMLILAQTACNLPQAVPAQATPGLPAVMSTSTSIPASATAAPASTSTPPAAASTPEVTQTSTSMPTATLSPSPTLTETPDPAKLFSSVNLSAQVISPGCEPKTVRFEVTPADPKVYSAVLFIRLHYKTAGDRTGWNDGFAMKPLNGKFIYDLKASAIPDFNKYKDPVAWVQFQLVAIDKSGTIIGRSEVFTDKLTLSATCS